MMRSLRLITPPAVEPISVDELKMQARIDQDTEDALLAAYITAARADVEAILRRALIEQTWEMRLDAWWSDDLELPYPPLISVDSVSYVDADDTTHMLNTGDYAVDTMSEPGRLSLLVDTPTAELANFGGVRISYKAGYGSLETSVPEPIRQAIRLLAAHYYENRESVLSAPGVNVAILPQAVDMLLWPYRVFEF